MTALDQVLYGSKTMFTVDKMIQFGLQFTGTEEEMDLIDNDGDEVHQKYNNTKGAKGAGFADRGFGIHHDCTGLVSELYSLFLDIELNESSWLWADCYTPNPRYDNIVPYYTDISGGLNRDDYGSLKMGSILIYHDPDPKRFSRGKCAHVVMYAGNSMILHCDRRGTTFENIYKYKEGNVRIVGIIEFPLPEY